MPLTAQSKTLLKRSKPSKKTGYGRRYLRQDNWTWLKGPVAYHTGRRCKFSLSRISTKVSKELYAHGRQIVVQNRMRTSQTRPSPYYIYRRFQSCQEERNVENSDGNRPKACRGSSSPFHAMMIQNNSFLVTSDEYYFQRRPPVHSLLVVSLQCLQTNVSNCNLSLWAALYTVGVSEGSNNAPSRFLHPKDNTIFTMARHPNHLERLRPESVYGGHMQYFADR